MGHCLQNRSLAAIEEEYQDVEERLLKVLEEWHAKTANPTCQMIIEALKKIDEAVLADKFKDFEACKIKKGELTPTAHAYLIVTFKNRYSF